MAENDRAGPEVGIGPRRARAGVTIGGPRRVGNQGDERALACGTCIRKRVTVLAGSELFEGIP